MQSAAWHLGGGAQAGACCTREHCCTATLEQPIAAEGSQVVPAAGEGIAHRSAAMPHARPAGGGSARLAAEGAQAMPAANLYLLQARASRTRLLQCHMRACQAATARAYQAAAARA